MIKLLIALVFISILNWAFQLRRESEIDKDGNPCVRYLGPRFGIPLCGLVAMIVGLIELNDPVNYRYSGNLLILAYTPLSLSFLIFCLSVYYWTFRVTLGKKVVTFTAWPFQSKQYNLSELTSLKETIGGKFSNNYVLQFSEGQQLKINGLLSGQSHFISTLRTVVKPSQLTDPGIEIPNIQHDDNYERSYKFPIRHGILWIALGVVFAIVPFFGAAPGKTIQLSGYLICFSITCFICVFGAYQLLYSVVIKHDRIIIRGFSSKEYLFAGIDSIELVSEADGQTAYIYLKNGKGLGIDGKLNGFKDMAQIIKARTSISRK